MLVRICRCYFRSSVNIRQLYSQLPYVVHRKKFLIPNKPIKPANAYFRTRKIIEKEQQEMDAGQKEAIAKQVSQKFTRYKQQMLIYRETYILPSKVSNLNGYTLFRSKYGREVMVDQNSVVKATIKLAKLWTELSDPQKQKWNEQALAKRKAQSSAIEAYNQLCLIPKVKKIRPLAIYIQEHKENYPGRFNSSLFQHYKQITEEVKKQYVARATKNSEESKVKMQKFLQFWNINKHQLNYYQNITARYEAEKKYKVLEKREKALQEGSQRLEKPENEIMEGLQKTFDQFNEDLE